MRLLTYMRRLDPRKMTFRVVASKQLADDLVLLTAIRVDPVYSTPPEPIQLAVLGNGAVPTSALGWYGAPVRNQHLVYTVLMTDDGVCNLSSVHCGYEPVLREVQMGAVRVNRRAVGR